MDAAGDHRQESGVLCAFVDAGQGRGARPPARERDVLRNHCRGNGEQSVTSEARVRWGT